MVFIAAGKWRSWEDCQDGWLCCHKMGNSHSSVMGLRTQSLMLILLSFLLCHNSCTSHVSIGYGGLTDGEGALWPGVEDCKAYHGVIA